MTKDLQFSDSLILREPGAEEGRALHALIRQSPPLDLNSVYCYYLLVRHFGQTSVVAEIDGELTGGVTAYLRPDEPETLFVWQVVVRADHRGRGLAGRMLEALLERPVCRGIRYLETTVGPTNHASRRCFERLAEARRCPVRQHAFLNPTHFGPDGQHEAEVLLRLGPFPSPTTAPATHEGTRDENL